MTKDLARASKTYGAMQTTILCAFSLAFFVDAGPRLFGPGTSAVVGAVLCGAGLLLLLSAFPSIGRVIQIAPEPRANGQLVTTGIYSRFRHPIYTAIVILVIGLFLRNPTIPVAVAAALVIVFLIFKVRFEEQLLRGRHPEYAAYERRAWGLFPGFRS
jgi:protein-S-isoprenylcysteine O-methyltransferase Ste14